MPLALPTNSNTAMSVTIDSSPETTNKVKEEPTLSDIWQLLNSNSTGINLELKQHREATKEKFTEVDAKVETNKCMIDELHRKVAAIESSATDASHESELAKQRNLRNNVSIMNIPYMEGENLKAIAVKVFAVLDVNITTADIHATYRRGDIIVIKLADYDTKAKIITNKTKNKIILRQVFPQLRPKKPNDEQIFVNNHTTPFMGRILQCGRNAVRDKRIASMRLTSKGCVMKFTNEGDEIVVKSIGQFIEILEKAPIVDASSQNDETQQIRTRRIASGSGINSSAKNDNKKTRNKNTGNNIKRRNRSFDAGASAEKNKNKPKLQRTDEMDCN